jgi:hypothetical protein
MDIPLMYRLYAMGAGTMTRSNTTEPPEARATFAATGRARSARVDPSNGTRIRSNIVFLLSPPAYDAQMNWHCGVTETELRINRRRSRLDRIAPGNVNELRDVREKGGMYSWQKANCPLHCCHTTSRGSFEESRVNRRASVSAGSILLFAWFITPTTPCSLVQPGG